VPKLDVTKCQFVTGDALMATVKQLPDEPLKAGGADDGDG
jgi:hypothetical protein